MENTDKDLLQKKANAIASNQDILKAAAIYKNFQSPDISLEDTRKKMNATMEEISPRKNDFENYTKYKQYIYAVGEKAIERVQENTQKAELYKKIDSAEVLNYKGSANHEYRIAAQEQRNGQKVQINDKKIAEKLFEKKFTPKQVENAINSCSPNAIGKDNSYGKNLANENSPKKEKSLER